MKRVTEPVKEVEFDDSSSIPKNSGRPDFHGIFQAKARFQKSLGVYQARMGELPASATRRSKDD